MKFFTKKKNSQKIMIVLLMVIVLNFSIPNYSQAVDWNNIAGDLLKELVQLVASFGDIVMGALNHFMLGTDKYMTSAMLDKDDANLSDSSSWLYYGGNKSEISAKRTVNEEDLDGFIFPDSWKIPNFLYCPENIFANKIAALDVNFVRAHEYTGVQVDESSTDDNKNSDESKSEQKAESAASGVIRTTIASWYNAFRNIAVVGLLTVLVYLGIRIVISSTATDKAKYKESLQDWLVALCLVFVIHIIMSGIMMFTDKFTEMIDESVDKPILVTVTGGDKDLQFKTNLTGFVRFKAQNKDFGECTAYTIMYMALVLYTVMFTFTYFKRFLYMAFFTMIAPLVALTYPIDKVKDGKAQAFDMWFREYTMNAIIQPVHLILYSVFIGSAIDLATSNPIYAIVTLAFLTSAEKWVKSMFGLDKAKTPAGLATMAGGALAMKGVGKVMGVLSGKGGNKGGSSAGTGSASLASRGVTPGIKMDKYKGLTSGMEAQQGSVQNSVDGQSQNTNNQSNNPTGETQGTGAGNRAQGTNTRGNGQQVLNNGQNMTDEETDKLNMDRGLWEKMANDPNFTEEERASARAHIAEIDERLNGGTTENQQNTQNSDEQTTTQRQNETQKATEQNARNEGENATIRNNADILSAGQKPPTKKERVITGVKKAWDAPVTRGVRGVVSGQARRFTNSFTGDNLKKKAKALGHGVLRTGAMAAAGATVGTMAAAAGVVSGEKAGTVLATGAGLAVATGKGLGDRAVAHADNKASQMHEDYMNARYTAQEQKQMKQEKADKEWKRNESNIKYMMKKGSGNGDTKSKMTREQAKKFLNDETTQRYRDNGIEDVGIIRNARNMAAENHWSEESAIARAKLAQERGKSLKDSDQNQQALIDRMMRENSSITREMAETFAKDIEKIADV